MTATLYKMSARSRDGASPGRIFSALAYRGVRRDKGFHRGVRGAEVVEVEVPLAHPLDHRHQASAVTAVIALVQPEQVFIVAPQIIPGAQGNLAVDDGLQDGDLAHTVQPIVDARRLQRVPQYCNRLPVVSGLLVQQTPGPAGLQPALAAWGPSAASSSATRVS